MQRRNFITLLGGAAAAFPLATRAQQPNRIERVGVLTASTGVDAQDNVRSLQQELQELGWTEGRNIRFDLRAVAPMIRMLHAPTRRSLLPRRQVSLSQLP